MRPARVIGAGIAGLTTAWHLADDSPSRCRGRCRTEASDPDPSVGGPVETAANAFVWGDTVAGTGSPARPGPVFARSESNGATSIAVAGRGDSPVESPSRPSWPAARHRRGL